MKKQSIWIGLEGMASPKKKPSSNGSSDSEM